VARELGVNLNTYENWEQNKYEREGRFFPAIIRFLGYDPESPHQCPSRTVSGRHDAGRGTLVRQLIVHLEAAGRESLDKIRRAASRA